MTPGVWTKKLGRSMSRLSSDGRWRGPDQKSPGHAWATDGRRTRTVGSYTSPHTRGRATHVRRSRTASSTSEHKTGEGRSSDTRLAPPAPRRARLIRFCAKDEVPVTLAQVVGVGRVPGDSRDQICNRR